jgi:CDP-glycerol glycerophosphotransferase
MIRNVRTLASLIFAGLARFVGVCVSLLVPKSRHVWIIGSWDGHRFADNSKWLFLWYHADPSRLDGNTLTWISRSRTIVQRLQQHGLPVQYLWSARGLWLSLRAGVHIFDSDSRGTAPWSARHAFSVNLFHGIALKHIGRDIQSGRSPILRANQGSRLERIALSFLCPWFTEQYSAVTASSLANAEVMQSAFRSEHPPWVTGLPRNDVLGMSMSDFKCSFFPFEHLPAKADERTVLYMPTFRDHERTSRKIPIPWQQLQDLLEATGSRLVLRLHSLDAAAVPDLATYSRIQLDRPDNDPYPLLRNADVLISDYSSVMFDFLIVDRPVILYCYDEEQYTSHARGLYYSLRDVAPGSIAGDASALMVQLADVLRSPLDTFASRRQEIRDFLVSTPAGESCAAVDRHLRSRPAHR